MDPISRPDLKFSRQEISAAFEPFVHERFERGDFRWLWRVGVLGTRELAKCVWRRSRTSLRRTSELQGSVRAEYEHTWSTLGLDDRLGVEGRAIPCAWGEQRMLARAIGTKRVHQLLQVRVLEQLAPRNVLEVGCGPGLNLFVFASHFPGVRFSGVELSASGVAAAQRVCELSELPDEIVAYGGDLVVDPTAHKNVDVRQGSARELPFGNDSFDVVFTMQALEAMEEIRHEALREISRVARRAVIMVEPFLDFNDRGIRRLRHTGNRYLRARVDELRQDGLEPLHVESDLPHKLALWPGLVVARPVQPSAPGSVQSGGVDA